MADVGDAEGQTLRTATPKRQGSAATAAASAAAETRTVEAPGRAAAAESLDLFSNANDVVVVKDEKMRG